MGANTFWGHQQGSILGSISFNIFFSDFLLVVQNVDFGSYADDNTIYDAGDNIDEVLFSLQESSEKLFKWFADNEIKTSKDKCHLTVSTNKLTEIQLGDNSDSEKFLGE